MSKQKVQNKSSAFITVQDLNIQPAELNVDKLFAQWIRALMQNWRQGTVAVKGRSDVSFSNKKPFKQKGTGRARAGSARSPLWRGGGVIFGPQQRVRKLKVNKELKKNVLKQLTHDFASAQKIVNMNWMPTGETPKTKSAYALLRELQLIDKKVILLLANQDQLAYASFINIPNLNIMLFDQVNAYDLANADYWLVLNQDLNAFKEMVAQWN
jgi:large subunit ribosomal protein L4